MTATKQQSKTSVIGFKAELAKIGSTMLLVLPESASSKLPSRGMVLVEGTVNGFHFRTPLEPDGKGSHWLKIDEVMREGAGLKAGSTAVLEIGPSKDWPEPVLPADLKSALAADSRATALWKEVTPMARWDWLRWISSTGRAETRKRRIDVAFSKLKAGTRRPCCFNRTMCTEPSISKNGVLLDPATAAN